MTLELKSAENGEQKVTIYYPELFDKVRRMCEVEELYELLEDIEQIVAEGKSGSLFFQDKIKKRFFLKTITSGEKRFLLQLFPDYCEVNHHFHPFIHSSINPSIRQSIHPSINHMIFFFFIH